MFGSMNYNIRDRKGKLNLEVTLEKVPTKETIKNIVCKAIGLEESAIVWAGIDLEKKEITYSTIVMKPLVYDFFYKRNDGRVEYENTFTLGRDPSRKDLETMYWKDAVGRNHWRIRSVWVNLERQQITFTDDFGYESKFENKPRIYFVTNDYEFVGEYEWTYYEDLSVFYLNLYERDAVCTKCYGHLCKSGWGQGVPRIFGTVKCQECFNKKEEVIQEKPKEDLYIFSDKEGTKGTIPQKEGNEWEIKECCKSSKFKKISDFGYEEGFLLFIIRDTFGYMSRDVRWISVDAENLVIEFECYTKAELWLCGRNFAGVSRVTHTYDHIPKNQWSYWKDLEEYDLSYRKDHKCHGKGCGKKLSSCWGLGQPTRFPTIACDSCYEELKKGTGQLHSYR